MKFLILLASVLLAVSAVSVREQWQDFKLKHGKNYKSMVEETKRFAIFQDAVRKIEEHNLKYESGESSYKMGINQFADMTLAEFKHQILVSNITRPKSDKTFHAGLVDPVSLPSSIDWTSKGAVTEVKDQGNCGSCYAFSSTASIESAYYLKHNELINLSEQEVVSCSSRYGNEGCDGGWSEAVFEYVKHQGLSTLKDYPYTARDGRCRTRTPYVYLDSYVHVAHDEDSLKAAVGTVGPISVAISADDIMYYESGIFDGRCSNKDDDLDHEVLLVGYGSSNGQAYWLFKNSWGTSWGEKGYGKFIIGRDICGIANDPIYPIVA